MKPTDSLPDADQLVAMLDALMENGSQHINLTVGNETKIQTVNSTECSPQGACAIPNLNLQDEDSEESLLSDD